MAGGDHDPSSCCCQFEAAARTGASRTFVVSAYKSACVVWRHGDEFVVCISSRLHAYISSPAPSLNCSTCTAFSALLVRSLRCTRYCLRSIFNFQTPLLRVNHSHVALTSPTKLSVQHFARSTLELTFYPIKWYWYIMGASAKRNGAKAMDAAADGTARTAVCNSVPRSLMSFSRTDRGVRCVRAWVSRSLLRGRRISRYVRHAQCRCVALSSLPTLGGYRWKFCHLLYKSTMSWEQVNAIARFTSPAYTTSVRHGCTCYIQRLSAHAKTPMY